MKSSILVVAATIVTVVYAQNIPREGFLRQLHASSNNKNVDVISGNAKSLRRQEAVTPPGPAIANGTTGVEVEEEEEESESESESGSSSSEEEEDEEEEEREEEEAETDETKTGQAEADGEAPAVGGGATSSAALIEGPSGQIAMGEGVTNVDGSCTCNAACPAGSMPT